MSSNQVIYQYLSPGSHTFTVPSGYSREVLVYAWGAGGGSGYSGGGGGDTYQRTVTTSRLVYLASLTGPSSSDRYATTTTTQTVTVSPG